MSLTELQNWACQIYLQLKLKTRNKRQNQPLNGLIHLHPNQDVKKLPQLSKKAVKIACFNNLLICSIKLRQTHYTQSKDLKRIQVVFINSQRTSAQAKSSQRKIAAK